MRSVVFLCVLFVVMAVKARDEGKIEQCECSSLMECRKRARDRETPCIEKCRRKLNHAKWNKEQGLKCFEQPENKEHHECMHELALKTCATDHNVMINRNETLHGGHRRHHRKPRLADSMESEMKDKRYEPDEQDSEDEHDVHPHHEQHRPREHNKRAFYAFIQRHFGKSGQAFVKCMQSCGRHRHHDKCPRELKCGIKKLPPKEFHQEMVKCHKKQTPRRFEVCSCLKDAGLSRLDCSSGPKKPESMTSTPKP